MANKINFTKQLLEGLALPEKGTRVEYWDARQPGLQLRITHTGVKTFFVKRRVKNEGVERVMLGRFPIITVEQARRMAADVVGKLATGDNVAATRRALRKESTFAELFNEYIERHAKPNKKTWAEDIQRYEQYLKNDLAKRKLSTIARQHIAAIHSDITMKGHGTVANRVLALVSSVFGKAQEWGALESNPAQGIKRNREVSRDRFLQSDELPRFFDALSEEENETARDFFLVALLTGARRANVLAMRWAEVSFERAEWRIPMTKNGTPQTVPLSSEVMAILKMRKESPAHNAEFVFPSNGVKGHLVEPKKAWMRILERAGLSDLRIHDLRRTLGSWQAKTGASLAVIGKSLNHKSTQTTAIYARLDLDPVRESVNRATSALIEAAKIGR